MKAGMSAMSEAYQPGLGGLVGWNPMARAARYTAGTPNPRMIAHSHARFGNNIPSKTVHTRITSTAA